MAYERDQLGWVQENHQPFDRTKTLSGLVEGALGHRAATAASCNADHKDVSLNF